MSHDSNRIYGAINVKEIYDFFGLSASYTGGSYNQANGIEMICSIPLINMWARNKPEAIGVPYRKLTDAERKANNFGLAPSTVYSGASNFKSAVNSGSFTGGWSYDYPKRSRNNCFRLGDLDGYNKNAKPPFGTLMPFKTTLTANTNNHTIIPLDAPESGDGAADNGLISIKDFEKSGASYKDWYFGVLLHSTARTFMTTASVPIGTLSDWQVDFGYIDPSYAATYKGVPFLSSKPFSVNGSEPADAQIIGIGSAGVTVELVKITQVYQFLLTCYFQGDSNVIFYDLEITNTSANTQSFSSVTLYAAANSSGLNSVIVASLGTISVPANGRVSKTGSKTLSAPSGYASNYYTFCRVSFTGASSADQTWVPVDQADLGPEG